MSMPGLGAIQDETILALRDLLPSGTRAALVDFPSHQNAGDSLIYAGERAYLDRAGIAVDYICDADRFDPQTLRARVPEGPILLHGGGNFGDRWAPFQLFRERVVSEFHDRQIIMLPQSMEFHSDAALEQTKKVFGAHPNMTLMMREQRSFAEALYHFGDHNAVVYCPDMAFGVGRLPYSGGTGAVEIVKLMRRDSESAGHRQFVTDHNTIELDWGLSGLDQVAWKTVRAPGRIAAKVPATAPTLYPLLSRSYGAQSALNLRRARKTLGIGRIVVTDRLHAAVLGGLMGVPVIALDNAYGKVSSIHSAYLHRLSHVTFASTVDEAVAQIYQVLP